MGWEGAIVPLSEKKRRRRARVYVLLRTIQGCRPENAVRILSRHTCVVAIDKLEGQPDILAVMEAPDRLKLAKAVVKALASVEFMTDSVELLPVKNRVPAVYAEIEPGAQ